MEALLRETPFQAENMEQWPQVGIQHVKPWFRLASLLGEGENCAVFSLGPTGREVVLSESDGSDSDNECDSSASSYSVSSALSCSETQGDSCSEGKEGGSGAVVEDDEYEPVAEEDVRVLAVTHMGRSQVVAKEFRHVDEDVGYVVWDSSENKPLKWFVDEEDCHDYMRRRQFTSPRFEARELACHIDERTMRFSDFSHEALTSTMMSLLVTNNLTPHITLVTGAVEYKNRGYLVMERVQGTMDDLLNEERLEVRMCGRLLTPGEIASLFFQTLFGLLTAQRVARLKHHDLHTGNVFLKSITSSTMWQGHALSTATHFHYHLDGVDYYLPNCGVLAKLGDFAMASYDVYGKRAQRIDMDAFNDDPGKWGYWNATFEGERGYDTQFLFADVPVDGRHRKCAQLHKFLKTVKSSAMGKKGKVTHKKGRPIAGHVSNNTADALIQSVFGRKPLPFFNFLVRPTDDGAVIVTLGNSNQFSVR